LACSASNQASASSSSHGEVERLAVRAQQQVGAQRGVDVEVQYAPQRRVPFLRPALLLRAVGGVQADQVVHAVAPGRGLVQQAGMLQFAQQHPGLGRGTGQQARGGGQCDVGPGRQVQQREGRGRRRGERAQGTGQHRAQRRQRVAGVQRVQPVRQVAQLGGQHAEREVGPPGRPGPDDPQRERQARAAGQQLGEGRRLGRGPLRAEVPDQRLVRLLRRERVQVEHVRAVRSGQRAEPVTTRHQHGAPRPARQQRRDLARVARVVGQDQHPAVGQQAAVQPDLRVRLDRDRRGGHPQRLEKPAHRRGRGERRPRGVEPAQVDVELAVRKAVQVPVRPLQRQPGLADPARPADRGDHQCAAVPGLLVHRRAQPRQLALPAREQPGRGGQLPRRHQSRTGYVRRFRRRERRRRYGYRRGSVRGGPLCPALHPAQVLLDPVARVRQHPPLARSRAEHLDQRVEAVGRRQGAGGEVLCDRRLRPPGPRGQLPVRQPAVPAAARVPPPQVPQQPRYVLDAVRERRGLGQQRRVLR
jgi:hypothetical protein